MIFELFMTMLTLFSWSLNFTNSYCPNKYWAANVSFVSNYHESRYNLPIFNLTEPEYKNKDVPTEVDKYGPKICQFCKSVMCLIVKQNKLNSNDELIMTCRTIDKLPNDTAIVEYLDCVQIGHKNRFHLFIYPSRYQKNPPTTVDCVDDDFLEWVSKDYQLKSLELGFPMKRVPNAAFGKYESILESIDRVKIDGSALIEKVFDMKANWVIRDHFDALLNISITGLNRSENPKNDEVKISNMTMKKTVKIPTGKEMIEEETKEGFECRKRTEDFKQRYKDKPNWSHRVEEYRKMCENLYIENRMLKENNLDKRQHLHDKKHNLKFPREKKCIYRLEETKITLGKIERSWQAKFASNILGAVVAVLTIGSVMTFCIRNRKNIVLFRKKSRVSFIRRSSLDNDVLPILSESGVFEDEPVTKTSKNWIKNATELENKPDLKNFYQDRLAQHQENIAFAKEMLQTRKASINK